MHCDCTFVGKDCDGPKEHLLRRRLCETVHTFCGGFPQVYKSLLKNCRVALINSGPDQGKLISRKQFPFLSVRHVDLKKCFAIEKDEI